MALQRPSFRPVSSGLKRVPKSYFRTRAGFTRTASLLVETRLDHSHLDTLSVQSLACSPTPRPPARRHRVHSFWTRAGFIRTKILRLGFRLNDTSAEVSNARAPRRSRVN